MKELEQICEIDPGVLDQYRQKFYRTLGVELRANAHCLPVAFAVMVAEPSGIGIVRFNIVVGAVEELMSKGLDQAAGMLKNSLREWERINYPDAVPLHEGGTA